MGNATDKREVREAWRKAANDVVAALGGNVGRGLSEDEAKARLAQYGPNELRAEAAPPWWLRFLSQFRSVLVILLLIATAISVGLWVIERDAALPYEAIAIFAVVLLNALMGYAQESRAEAAVAALRAMSADAAAVLRDGKPRKVRASEIVPGDIVRLEEGDTIPADGRLVTSTALKTMEASLTGESVAVTKDTGAHDAEVLPLADRTNMVFSGTTVAYGRGTAVVTATGMETEVGRIAGLLDATHREVTPLQRELDRTGKAIGVTVAVIAAVMVATIILVAEVRGLPAMVQVLILGVALAVAAVPEGLPAIVTAVLSIGVQRMAHRNAIVRHLAAVETLGSASAIASDKTGTLTKNEMTVQAVATASGVVLFSGTGYAPEGTVEREGGGAIDEGLRSELERALAVADRANNADVHQRDGRWTVYGDPTEGALIVAAWKAGLREDALDTRLPRVGEVPFSSERKLMSTMHRDAERDERLVMFTKGAPDILIARCTHELVAGVARELTPARRTEILGVNNALADRALRTLGVAFRRFPSSVIAEDAIDQSLEHDLVFAGLIGMIDPPRPEAFDAVARARAAGIRPLVVTGDHPRTAAVVARELGIPGDGRTVTGAELARMDDDALFQTVRTVSVYARVNPEDKLRIVKALQRDGVIVAMTGDGVNDAPALKTADIGVAMGITGTDVAKQAADIVLADDNFATIVAAVEEGRAIFANIRKFLRFLLSSNIGEVLTMFFGVLLASRIELPSEGNGLVLPLLATQVLWINLVTDGAPALALGVDPPDEGLMQQPPRPHGEGVITAAMWRAIFLVGVIMAVGTMYVLDASLPGGFVAGTGDLRYAQSMAFTTLVLFQLFNVLNARSETASAFSHLFANWRLWGAIGLSVGLQALALYAPAMQRAFGTTGLGAQDWLTCVVVASSVLWIMEIVKLVRRARSLRAT